MDLVTASLRLVPAMTGLVVAAPGLIVDLDGCRYDRVEQVSGLIEKSDVNVPHSIGLTDQKVVHRSVVGDLNASVGTLIRSGKGRIDFVGPCRSLISAATRLIGNVYAEISILVGIGCVRWGGDDDGVSPKGKGAKAKGCKCQKYGSPGLG